MSSPKGLSAPARLHLEQQRQLLKEHPHLRAYSGPQPLQLVAVLALLAARWGLAYLLRDSPLVLIGVAASTLGVSVCNLSVSTKDEKSRRRSASRIERNNMQTPLRGEETYGSAA